MGTKSLAIVIPSKIVKEHKINPSTCFILSSKDSGLLLQFIDTKNNACTLPIDHSFAADQSIGKEKCQRND